MAEMTTKKAFGKQCNVMLGDGDLDETGKPVVRSKVTVMVMKLASLLSGAQCASKVARPRLSGTESTSLDSPEFYEGSEN